MFALFAAMDPVLYSLDETINGFFSSHSPVTRQECDDLAATLVGEPVKPLPSCIQGSFSHTVAAETTQSSRIVQFRDASSALNMQITSIARQGRGELVPVCIFHGDIGQVSRIFIYSMNKLPGIIHLGTVSL